jgi:hypothetical protein
MIRIGIARRPHAGDGREACLAVRVKGPPKPKWTTRYRDLKSRTGTWTLTQGPKRP